jgi:predicted GIY-YIG superfamily endonuclease
MKKHLYIFKAKNNPIYKIGVSNNVPARLETVKTMSPIPITLYDIFKELKDAMRVEKLIHKHFNEYRTHGEWFQLTNIQVKTLKDKIYEYDTSSTLKINKRKLVTEYNVSFNTLINDYFRLLEDGEFIFETNNKRKRPLIAERLGISDGNLGRLISIYKSNPKLIDKMDKENISINFAYQLVKNPH